jgi:hypothetical protein
VDFEFHQPPGECPRAICAVARELHSGRIIRQWLWDNAAQPCPYPTDQRALFVAYYASAEMTCHLQLGWPMPTHLLDLFAEFRCLTNGLHPLCGSSLLGACTYFNIPAIPAAEKEEMRQLAARGGPYSADEQRQQLDYCQTDVDALQPLLVKMAPHIDAPRALLRARYMKAAAQIECTGVPMDRPTYRRVAQHGPALVDALTAQVDRSFGVFRDGSFSQDLFLHYCNDHNIPWPRLQSGAPDLKDETFKLFAGTYPQLEPLRQLRKARGKLRNVCLQVGSDGRNRCLLSAFSSLTGRNQPSSNKFVFGTDAWLRHLVKPIEGTAISYIDFGQEEFAIAAALSGDERMWDAYQSGDPYLTFAKQAGAVPPDGTKASHPHERHLFKECCLGVQYGMGEQLLALKLRISTTRARHLIEAHKRIYATYWRWSRMLQDSAAFGSRLRSPLGWYMTPSPHQRPASIRNFPLQSAGGDILRVACIKIVEAGITLCAPIHDAVVIEAPVDDIEAVNAKAQSLMADASRAVLGGYEIRTDSAVVRYPDRYQDLRGAEMWKLVTKLLPGEPGIET